jgi:hypothetical protein
VTVRVRPVSLKFDKHWWSSGDDSALVTRQRGFDSRPVLLLFYNLVRMQRAHDVAVASLLAMQDVPVQLRLGASFQRVGKPGIPRASGARDRRFESDHADLIAVGPVLVRVGGC